MSIKTDTYSRDFDNYLESYILVYWPREKIVEFCARILDVDVENMRAWIARREARMP